MIVVVLKFKKLAFNNPGETWFF